MPSTLFAGDMPADHWIDRRLPTRWRPYGKLARLDRPIGTWLLLFPGWWAMALAAEPLPPIWPMILFALGALVMRGAGCTVNDIADRDIDARVARTRTRPLPSGAITLPQAFLFLALQLAIGLAVLIQFNGFTIALAVAALPLVAVYPFMKRLTWWPQAFLGLTFNWGALVGWSAITGGLAPAALLLYGAGIFWTLGYDTIYAHQDKEDDALVGVKSSARRLGRATVPWLGAFYASALVLIGLAGWQAGLGPWFGLALLPAAAQLLWQILTVDIDDAHSCLVRFKSNRWFGWLLLAAIILGKLPAS